MVLNLNEEKNETQIINHAAHARRCPLHDHGQHCCSMGRHRHVGNRKRHKECFESYEAEQITSDGDLMELVWKSLPSGTQFSTIYIYRDKFIAATEDTDGSITFYVALDDELVTEEGNPFTARIPKLGKAVDNTFSAALEEDWSLAGKALTKVSISNATTKEQLLSAAKAAVKNGSTCDLSENKFYKVEATTNKEGSITIYIAVSLKG